MNKNVADHYHGNATDMSSSTAESILILLGASLVTVLVTTSNLAVIITVATTKTLHTTTNFNIMSLSIADLMVGLGAVPMGIAYTQFSFLLPCLVRSIYMYIAHVSITACVGAMVIIAVDRHRAIASPLKSPFSTKFTVISSVLNWTFAFLFNSLMFGIKIHGESSPSRVLAPCEIPFENRVAETVEFVMLFLLPLLVTLATYGHICYVLYRHEKAVARTVVSKSAMRHHQRAVKMMLIIVAIFTVCWLPHNLVSLTIAWNEPGFIHVRVKIVTLFLLSSNSWLNVIVYAYFSHAFREAVSELLMRCWGWCCCSRQSAIQRQHGRFAVPTTDDDTPRDDRVEERVDI